MLNTVDLADGRVRCYSDANLMIKQIETGRVYEDAVDVKPLRYTYEETDIPIAEGDPSVEDKAEAYDILMGVKS